MREWLKERSKDLPPQDTLEAETKKDQMNKPIRQVSPTCPTDPTYALEGGHQIQVGVVEMRNTSVVELEADSRYGWEEGTNVCEGTSRGLFIEVCCEEESELSLRAMEQGWMVLRITEEMNILRDSTEDGVEWWIRKTLSAGLRVYIHHSFPCTAVCGWSDFNIKQNPYMAKKIYLAREALKTMIVKWTKFLARLISSGC